MFRIDSPEKTFNSIQFKQTLLGYNDYDTQIYAAVNSLFSDTKKKPQSLSQEQKTENDDIHTDRFKHYMEGIVPLWTLTPPPPTQCISDPLLLFSTCTQLVIPIYLNFLPNTRHMITQL